MDMQGTRQLAVTQQQAWDCLNNPEVLKACIPGCDRIEQTTPEEYQIGMALKIGPVSAKFSGKIMLSEMNPPASYTLNFEGQGGVAGFGKGQAQVKLLPNEGGCELQYVVNAQVGGKIAQLGQRLIDGAAKSLSEEFFKKFDLETSKLMPSVAADAPLQASSPDAADVSDSSGLFNARNIALAALLVVALYFILR
jgi:uncharacterized protein